MQSVSREAPCPGDDQMNAEPIAAEITPQSGQAKAAALALQRLGFRVLHIGPTISVEGPETLWQSVFDVSFKIQSKDILRDMPGGETTYRKAITDDMAIPADLQPLISDVAFVEPPELY